MGEATDGAPTCKHRRYRALCQSHIDVNLVTEHRTVALFEPTPCEWCTDDDVRSDGMAAAMVDLRTYPEEA